MKPARGSPDLLQHPGSQRRRRRRWGGPVRGRQRHRCMCARAEQLPANHAATADLPGYAMAALEGEPRAEASKQASGNEGVQSISSSFNEARGSEPPWPRSGSGPPTLPQRAQRGDRWCCAMQPAASKCNL